MKIVDANNVAKTAISTAESANRVLLQTSVSASQMYATAVTSISSIVANKDMSESNKTTALNNAVTALNSGLALFKTLGNLDLDIDLTFGGAIPIVIPPVTPPVRDDPGGTQSTWSPVGGVKDPNFKSVVQQVNDR
jgi:hypothetical protein